MESVSSLVNILVVLVFITAFLFCYLYLGRRANLPPGPPGLPILGSFLWLNGIKKKGIKQYQALFEASKTYGDVISFKLLGQRFVYLNGYKTIREAFVSNGDVFRDRPSWLKSHKESIKEGKGVAFQSGHPWKVLRKFVLQTLRDFVVGKTSLEQKIMREVDAASEFLYVTDGKPSGVRLLTSMMITYVIYGIVFAKRFEYNDETFHEIIENLDKHFHQGGGAPAPAGIPTFILKLIHKEGNMFLVIMDLFIAGSETTSNTINWCMLFLQEYPDIQKKCQDEIFERCGNKVVTWADKGSLPYIEATLFEIQRMANIAPTSVPHTNEVDVNFGGYFIPKRTLIIANLYSSNMDSRHWDQPEIFNPERFIEDGKLKKNPALIPFSIGPRICLGQTLAKMETFLIFTNLLQRFNFCREDDNVKHSFENILEQSINAPKPYRTRAVKRV